MKKTLYTLAATSTVFIVAFLLIAESYESVQQRAAKTAQANSEHPGAGEIGQPEHRPVNVEDRCRRVPGSRM